MCRILLEQKSQNWTPEEQPRASTPAVTAVRAWARGSGSSRPGSSLLSLPGASLSSPQPRILPARQPGRLVRGDFAAIGGAAGPSCSVPGRGGSGDGSESGRSERASGEEGRLPRPPAPRAQAGAEAVSEGEGRR